MGPHILNAGVRFGVSLMLVLVLEDLASRRIILKMVDICKCKGLNEVANFVNKWRKSIVGLDKSMWFLMLVELTRCMYSY